MCWTRYFEQHLSTYHDCAQREQHGPNISLHNSNSVQEADVRGSLFDEHVLYPQPVARRQGFLYFLLSKLSEVLELTTIVLQISLPQKSSVLQMGSTVSLRLPV